MCVSQFLCQSFTLSPLSRTWEMRQKFWKEIFVQRFLDNGSNKSQRLKVRYQKSTQPANQSINPSINQSINQSIESAHSLNPLINQSIENIPAAPRKKMTFGFRRSPAVLIFAPAPTNNLLLIEWRNFSRVRTTIPPIYHAPVSTENTIGNWQLRSCRKWGITPASIRRPLCITLKTTDLKFILSVVEERRSKSNSATYFPSKRRPRIF